jgi:hypothetical protein
VPVTGCGMTVHNDGLPMCTILVQKSSARYNQPALSGRLPVTSHGILIIPLKSNALFIYFPAGEITGRLVWFLQDNPYV